jgi:DNA repair exonuclease SbcCD ATPase subunit
MSKGQKTRINLAILFAVVDLIKKMGNVKCNLLMLDEFADEGLDPKGFSAAVEAIRKVADRDNKSIVLITHKQEDVLFDNLNALYEVELKNSFSILKEVPSF